MKDISTKQPEKITDVLCDVCGCSTCVEGYGAQFGTLQARWGYGSQHDGERYKLQLCEFCFFQVLANLRRERVVQTMFDEQETDLESFGRVARDDFWGEG